MDKKQLLSFQQKKKYYKKQKKHILKKKLPSIKIKKLIQNLSKEEKDKIKEYQRKRYQQLIQYKKEALQNK